MKSDLESALLTIGRIGLASLFLLGGAQKVVRYEATLDMMREAGMPAVELLLPLVIVLEGVGGTLIAFAGPVASLAAVVLMAHTLLINLIFHDFWSMSGDRAVLGAALFFKNVSIAGALLFVAVVLDRWRYGERK